MGEVLYKRPIINIEVEVMLKMKEISTLDSAAINLKVSELRKEIFDMKLQKATTNVERTHMLRDNRRDIARLLTVLNTEESK